MVVHLIDGTYELYRQFYGLRRFNQGNDRPFGAVVGGGVTLDPILVGVARPVHIRRRRPCAGSST